MHAFDRQTEFSSLDRVCISCSAVKMIESSWKFQQRCIFEDLGGYLHPEYGLGLRIRTGFALAKVCVLSFII